MHDVADFVSVYNPFQRHFCCWRKQFLKQFSSVVEVLQKWNSSCSSFNFLWFRQCMYKYLKSFISGVFSTCTTFYSFIHQIHLAYTSALELWKSRLSMRSQEHLCESNRLTLKHWTGLVLQLIVRLIVTFQWR